MGIAHDSSSIIKPHAGHCQLHNGQAGWLFWWHWVFVWSLSVLLYLFLVERKIGEVGLPYEFLISICILLSIPFYSAAGPFRKVAWIDRLYRLFIAWGLLVSFLAIMAFASKEGATYSREVLLTWSLLLLPIQAMGFLLSDAVADTLGLKGKCKKGLLIAEKASTFINVIQEKKLFKFVDFVELESSLKGLAKAPYEDWVERVEQSVKKNKIKIIFLVLPIGEEGYDLNKLYKPLSNLQLDVMWVPDTTGVETLGAKIFDVEGIPVHALNMSPLSANPNAALLKRTFDFFGAAFLLLFFLPLMLLISVLLKISSSGPVIFKQKRHGLDGIVFDLYKFRSMKQHSAKKLKQATRDDARVTWIGKWIRKTSIDELPQLWNVIKGDMSLVGPRPHAVEHNDYYADQLKSYMSRHRVLPGMTGLAQIEGYRGETSVNELMEERVKRDIKYINSWSIKLDFMILLKTPMALLKGNAY